MNIKVTKITDEAGYYATVEGTGNVLKAINDVADSNTEPLCSGYGVFPGGGSVLDVVIAKTDQIRRYPVRITKPSVEFLGAVPTDYTGALKFIERCSRTCYKSEDKITDESAEPFVKNVLIKAGHLAMVEHSNFVVCKNIEKTNSMWITAMPGLLGKYLNYVVVAGTTLFIGGNLTAWHQHAANRGSYSFLGPFKRSYGEALFGVPKPTSYDTESWKVCPHNEIPKELQRYSARFICDRGVSHELVRHRPCSFAQESTRYVSYGGKDMEFIEPAGFEDWDEDLRAIFKRNCDYSEAHYNYMVANGSRPQQARAVLPNALKTEIVVTADLAEWEHIFKLRCAKDAHPDMRRVMIPLRDRFIEEGLV